MVREVAKAGSRKLDGIAGAAEQEIWLATERPVAMQRLRRADRGEQGKYLSEYEALSHAEGWPALRRVVKTYLERCIFEPFATEGEFWSTTCKPGFVRVNLHGQETFGAGLTEGGDVVYWLHARKSLLDPILASEKKLFENFHLVDAFDGNKQLYKAGGEDQIRLETAISKEEATLAIFDHPGALLAIKTFNLELMRKGTNTWRRSHCVDLVDEVLSDLYVADGGRASSSPGTSDDLFARAAIDFADQIRNLPDETEIRREVVQRIGQAIFRKMMDWRWREKCHLTGIDRRELLRASHIKPWAVCDAGDPRKERLNEHNGLLLAAHLDAAFDAGLVSFSDDGRLLRSPILSDSNFRALGTAPDAKIELSEQARLFMAWHRCEHGYGN